MYTVQHFPKNTTGRTFVVGDLHGCIADLQNALSAIGFNTTTDILYATGDLIDRGPDSLATVSLIYEPWFRSVMGNHDQMMMCTMLDNHPAMANCWLANGGEWRFNHEEWQLKDIAGDMRAKMPCVITVGEGEDRFNVVHAEFLKQRMDSMYVKHRHPVTNADIDDWTFDDDDVGNMLWGWGLINEPNRSSFKFEHKRYHDPSLSITYVGHSTVTAPLQRERQIFLDGGATYHYYNNDGKKQDSLIIAEPYAETFYQYWMHSKSVDEFYYNDISKHFQ